MWYTESEIVRSYRQNPKKEQIVILSELNQVSTNTIERILQENGILKKKRGRKKKADVAK